MHLVTIEKWRKESDQSIYLRQGISHSACISFWITKRQAISTDTSFETKMMLKSGGIEIIFKYHEPFQSYLLTGQA